MQSALQIARSTVQRQRDANMKIEATIGRLIISIILQARFLRLQGPQRS